MIPNFDSETIRNGIAYLLKYGFSSLLSVFCDFLIYGGLVYLRILQPGQSNLVSSFIGFIVGWLIAGRLIFRKYHISKTKYLAWFVYLTAVLLALTHLLNFLVHNRVDPYLGKIIITGISFCANSLVFRFYILRT